MAVNYEFATHDPKEIDRICRDVGEIYCRAIMAGDYDPQRAEEGRKRMEAILRDREAKETKKAPA